MPSRHIHTSLQGERVKFKFMIFITKDVTIIVIESAAITETSRSRSGGRSVRDHIERLWGIFVQEHACAFKFQIS